MCVCVCGTLQNGEAMRHWSVNCGSWPFHGWDLTAFARHDEITREKKSPNTYSPTTLNTCLSEAWGGVRTSGLGQKQTHTCTNSFGSSMSTGGDSINHRCICLGNTGQVCVFGKMSKVVMIEQVNTIWERRHWTPTRAVHLPTEKLLATAVSQFCTSTCFPATHTWAQREDVGQLGEGGCFAPFLLEWGGTSGSLWL